MRVGGKNLVREFPLEGEGLSRGNSWVSNHYEAVIETCRIDGPDVYFFSQAWIKELNDALCHQLDSSDRVFGIASGLGEHEALLNLRGIPASASDVLPSVVSAAQELWPEMEVVRLDALDSEEVVAASEDFSVLLCSGLDPVLDSTDFMKMLGTFRCFLSVSQDRRVLFVLRFRDNLLTRAIDFFFLPLDRFLANTFWRIRGSPTRLVGTVHGFRRSVKEVLATFGEAGLHLSANPAYAGYGIEVRRSVVLSRLPLFGFLQRLRSSCNCVVFVLTNQQEGVVNLA